MRSPRVTATLLTLTALAVLAACGGDDGGDAATTLAPLPSTSAPDTAAPVTEPPATEAPATTPPATEPPATDPPATEPPATEPPVTEPPATEPPATEPPASNPEPGSTDPAAVFEINADVTGGEPTDGVASYLVEVGQTVRITITSDTPDVAHLHGFDLEADVGPDAPAVLTFTADQAGSFEMELHESGALLFYLDVT